MDDTTLRALFTVIQCGSFSKAAAQLGYTQSGITHMMNRLETELGCRLFQRTSHGVHLSKAGEHLLPYMQDVLAACDTLRQEASGSSEASNRVLRVGCYGSIARGWMPQVLPAFRRLHPEIRVEVLVRGRELLQALEEDRINLALVDDHSFRHFKWVPLISSPLVAVVPLDYPWTEPTITMEALLQSPFLSTPEQYVDPLLPPDLIRLQVDASDDATVLAMIAAGMGVSVLPALSLAGYEEKVRTIPLRQPIQCRLGIAMKPLRGASAPTRSFVSYLKQYTNNPMV